MPSDSEIVAGYNEAAARWPGISLSLPCFQAMLESAAVTAVGLQQWGGDLYLACAAGVGDPVALRVIDENYIARLPGRIRRLGAGTDTVSDVLQTVRERMFSGDPPRILAYNGAGPLQQWIKVVAIRTAIDLHRTNASVPRIEAAWLETIPPPAADADAVLMKVEYKLELELALRDVVARLSPRDRAVLRLHVIEGVSIEKIAASYGVHRVTVARWVWTAGETLLDALRQRFRERFGIAPREFDSIARLARSRLSLDLTALLAG